jgi:glycosyltransferase involved in cell wall biosynthesis
MLQIATQTRLDRSRWHKPLVSVIVTHHNYSHHVRDALLSVLDQTYENWECVVVDDGSEPEHSAAVECIVDDIGSPKIRLVKLPENVGQMPAAFAGLDKTSGAFVCILDPDDRYAETFIEDAVTGHLNETVYCPVLAVDQYIVANGSVIAGTYTHHRRRFIETVHGLNVIPERPQVRLLYYSAGWGGWHWGSTSAIMFRRAAMELMRPNAPVDWFKEVDTYLAQGAHRLGGTLFLTKSLVYRSVHENNSYLVNRIISLEHQEGKFDGAARGRLRLQDAIKAIKANGGEALLHRYDPWAPQPRGLRGMPARLKRSFNKRWRRWRTAR